jgi:hypothetical protein
MGDPEDGLGARYNRQVALKETLLKWAGGTWLADALSHAASMVIKGDALTLTYGAAGYELANKAWAMGAEQGWPDGFRPQLLALGVNAIRVIGNRTGGRSDQTVQLRQDPADIAKAVVWPVRLYGGHHRFGHGMVFPCKAEASRLAAALGVEVEWVATADRTITWKLDRIDGDSATYNGYTSYPDGWTRWSDWFRVEPCRYSIAGPGDRRGLAFELVENLWPAWEEEAD